MKVRIQEADLQWSALRAQGPGGQHVNKVSSAVQLRYDIGAAALPEAVKARLLALPDSRISAQGVLTLKAQSQRSQLRNRAEALARLLALIEQAAQPERVRRATRPSRASVQRRLADKQQLGERKRARSRAGREQPW